MITTIPPTNDNNESSENSGLNNNNNPSDSHKKKGIKRRREGPVSKYEICCDMDTELKRGNPLWLYLTSIAVYPGNTDEYLENNRYHGSIINV